MAKEGVLPEEATRNTHSACQFLRNRKHHSYSGRRVLWKGPKEESWTTPLGKDHLKVGVLLVHSFLGLDHPQCALRPLVGCAHLDRLPISGLETPGLVQLACLTRSLYLISLYTLEHCGMKPMKYMYNPSLPPVHEIPEKLTLAVADPNPPTQIPHCLASLFGIKVGWILSAFSCPPITLLTEASVLYGFCPHGFDYP